jgi:exodeoxyribonuclease X
MADCELDRRPPFIAVFDLETTGPPEHAPVEIGRCDLLAGSLDPFGHPASWGEITLPISALINPGRPIPAEASAVHHLVDENVMNAPRWGEISKFARIGERVRAFAAHSAKTERQWLTPELVGASPWICTWKCALRAWPEAPGHGNQVLRYWLKPEGLHRALAAPAHRAGPDAYVTAHLLRELLRLYPLERLIAWSEEPAVLVRVPFGKATRGMRWTEVEDDFLLWVLDRDFSEDILHTARVELDRRRAAAEEAVG